MLQKIQALKNHEGFKRYATNTSWVMAEKVLRMFVGLLVGVWVARYLGPDQFGLLSYAHSFVFLFTAVATLGLDGIVVRELVRNDSQRDVLMGTAFGLKLVGAVLILPVLVIAIQFTSNDQFTNLLIFVTASAIIFQSFNVIDFYFQSQVLSKYVALANTSSLAISSIIKISLILGEAPLIAFAVMYIFDAAVLALGLVYFYLKTCNLKLMYWRFDRQVAKSLLRNSWPLIMSGLVISVYMKIDQVMINEIIDSEAVGQYAAAVRLSEAWYFIPMAIASSLFPALLSAKNRNKKIYNEQFQRLYTLMIWLAIAIALPMTFLSEWLIMLLFGDSYNQSGNALMVHVWAGIFVFLGVASGKWMLAENLQVYSMINTTIGAAVNITANYFLINKFGILGAAVSTLISYSIAAYFCLLLSRRTRSNFFNVTKSIIFIWAFHDKKAAQ